MKWLPKILAFQAFSRLPGGKRLYHGIQEHHTRSNVPSPERFGAKAEIGLRYWDWLKENTPPGWLEKAPHLDFGAGWLPSIPVLFHALGMERQYLADLHEHMTAAHVRGTIEVINGLEGNFPRPLPRVPEVPAASCTRDEIFAQLGIRYAVPAGPFLETHAGQISVVTATDMLMHLSRETLRLVFRQIFAALAPGGFFLAETYMLQLFGNLQDRIPPRLVFRLPAWVWEHCVNSPLMSYSRLKAPDYRALLEEAGFRIRKFVVTPGTPQELATVKGFEPHRDFRHLTADDLAARYLAFVVQKPE